MALAVVPQVVSGNEPLYPNHPSSAFFPEDTTEEDEGTLPYPIEDRRGDFITDDPSNPFYLDDPDEVDQNVEYQSEENRYMIEEKVGEDYYRDPTYMSMEEFINHQSEQQRKDYWKERAEASSLVDDESVLPEVSVENDFFDNIFGGTEIDIRPSGNIDITFGFNHQRIENPTLTERQRTQGGFNFDMNINMSVVGKIGDLMKLNVDYNTEANFDFENQIKLEYTGEEDDIIQKIEAGNVDFPLSTSLINGNQSLFGAKTKLQFGRMTITSVFSQQKSKSESITIENGAQTQEFEVKIDQYDENRHFFLAQYFRNNYNQALNNLPNINSLVDINKLEVWVTNKQGRTENIREVAGFMDLGEPAPYRDDQIQKTGSGSLPRNGVNSLYRELVNTPNTRSTSQIVNVLQQPPFQLEDVQDFEKTYARKLSQSEYTYHEKLGYISLNQSLQPDEMLAVAFEYTYNGKVYKVGEFAQDVPPDSSNTDKVLFLKMLKSTAVRPNLPIWDLMMKNVYSLGGFQINSNDFELNVLYEDPGSGVKRYIPEGSLKGVPLIRLLNLDNLNSNNDPQPDGVFDYMPGITIKPQNGRIIFPVVEPFGDALEKEFQNKNIADKYVYDELYDSTKTVAQQYPQYNRFVLDGSFKSSVSSEISLGAFNVPEGSVVVTAGGKKLEEGVDYTVDYQLGRIKIINQGILNSGVPINVSFENNALFGFKQKTMMGTRLDYWINDNFTLGATWKRLAERPFTEKVNIGEGPIANNIYGFDANYSDESRFITKMVDGLPFYETKTTSSFSLNGEVAKLDPGHSNAINQGDKGQVYIDDFEGTRSSFDLKFPANEWKLASTPQGARDKTGQVMFPEADRINDLSYGYNRAKLAWYNIDPLFLRDNVNTPDYIKNDDDMQSNHYVREILQEEVFPNKDQERPGLNSNLVTFDMAYYPDERGSYNFEQQPDGSDVSEGINKDGTLKDPRSRWAGIQRSIRNNDFEEANVEYIEFWVMDPYMYDSSTNGGEVYINLGNVSEDVLKDGQQFYENGLPGPNSSVKVDTTKWTAVPQSKPVNPNAFDNDPAARKLQDIGLNGMNDEGERQNYSAFLDDLNGYLNPDAYDDVEDDPANDNYHYYRGDDYNDRKLSILERYKKFNNTQGNSPVSDNSNNYSSAATNEPDAEDLNRDNSLSKSESYFQYRVKMQPNMEVGENFISDKRTAQVSLENGNTDQVTWYQFKIPIDDYQQKVGNIQDFRSIRFIRMFMTDFQQDVVLRFADLELVRNQWRRYRFSLKEPGEYVPDDNTGETSFDVSAVNIEENSQKEPFNYVLPPGIQREENLNNQNYTTLQNEQSLSTEVCGLQDGDSRAVYKSLDLDLRKFKRLKMFIHGESVIGEQPVQTGDLRVFVRIGSDFKENYYEYEIPLTITPTSAGSSDPEAIWPQENNLNIKLDSLIQVKQARNQADRDRFSKYTLEKNNGTRISLKGNPNLGEVKNVMLGIRNPKAEAGDGTEDDGLSKCAEVWFNEMRLSGMEEKGGWAALARAEAQLADLGDVSLSANMHTSGYGQINQKINERYKDDFFQYDVSTNLQLGKFFPKEWGLRVPMYAGFTQSFSTPRFDPYDKDVPLDDKLAVMDGEEKRDYRRKTQDIKTIKSLNFTNVRKQATGKGKPMPWSISNWNATFAYTETVESDPTIKEESEKVYKGKLGYNYSPSETYVEPFKNMIKSKSDWLEPIKAINFNPVPSNLNFSTEMNRKFGKTQLRSLATEEIEIKPTYDKDFTWDRFYGFQYNPFRALSLDFNARNMARIDEPRGAINTQQKKDSIWTNIFDFGRTTSYNHSVGANYKVPIDKIPIFDWVSAQAGYNVSYNWESGGFYRTNQGNLIENPFGNKIRNSQDIKLNGELNIKKLYNKVPFLKPYNKNRRRQQDRQKIRQKFRKNKRQINNDIDNLKDEKRQIKEDIRDVRRDDDMTRQEKRQKIKQLRKKKRQTRQNIRKLRKNRRKLRRPAHPAASAFIKPLIGLKRISINYTENRSTRVPGYTPKTNILGMNNGFNAPGWDFIFGYQPEQAWLDRHAEEWITEDTSLNHKFTQSVTKNLTIRGVFEPIRDLRIDLNASKSRTENHSEFFKKRTPDGPYEHLTPQQRGSFNISFFALQTMFSESINQGRSETFQQFEENRKTISERLSNQNPNSNGDFVSPVDTIPVQGYKDGYGPYSQDVLIPAFVSAYTRQEPKDAELNPFDMLPRPNWRLNYKGLGKLPFLQNIVNSINISHNYNSQFNINGYSSDLNFEGDGRFSPSSKDTITGNFHEKFEIPQAQISEQLSPLIGVDITWANNMTTRFNYKKTRNLSMSFIDYQLSERKSEEITFGFGYRMQGMTFPLQIGGKQLELNNDINFKLDFSYRNNVTVNRKLDQDISEATNGMKTYKLSPSIDYTINKQLSAKLFYDFSKSIPATSSSYPITNHKGGITLRFTLTP